MKRLLALAIIMFHSTLSFSNDHIHDLGSIDLNVQDVSTGALISYPNMGIREGDRDCLILDDYWSVEKISLQDKLQFAKSLLVLDGYDESDAMKLSPVIRGTRVVFFLKSDFLYLTRITVKDKVGEVLADKVRRTFGDTRVSLVYIAGCRY